MSALLQAIGLVVAGIISLRSGLLAYHLLRGNIHAYNENRLRTKSFLGALRGRMSTLYDGRRDYRVAAGIAFDRKNRVWVDQGKLSEEAISSTLKI